MSQLKRNCCFTNNLYVHYFFQMIKEHFSLFICLHTFVFSEALRDAIIWYVYMLMSCFMTIGDTLRECGADFVFFFISHKSMLTFDILFKYSFLRNFIKRLIMQKQRYCNVFFTSVFFFLSNFFETAYT